MVTVWGPGVTPTVEPLGMAVVGVRAAALSPVTPPVAGVDGAGKAPGARLAEPEGRVALSGDHHRRHPVAVRCDGVRVEDRARLLDARGDAVEALELVPADAFAATRVRRHAGAVDLE